MMPTVTKNLIIINVLVFFGTIVAQRYGLDLTNYLGLHFFLASDFNPAQLITYMFMHGGFSHIFFNMFVVMRLRRQLAGGSQVLNDLTQVYKITAAFSLSYLFSHQK